MTLLLRLTGLVIAAAMLLVTAWASTAPLSVADSDDAVIRLSIGARPERIESCRRVSDEELAKLAPQMRQRVVCEGATARYGLELRRNGEVLHSQVVRGGGLRHDRQLYVSRDIPVPSGPASVRVQLVRLDTVSGEERNREARDEDARDAREREERHEGDEGGREDREAMPGRREREADERRRRREEAIPAELRLETQPTLAPREVLLVSYDPGTRRLVARRGGQTAP